MQQTGTKTLLGWGAIGLLAMALFGCLGAPNLTGSEGSARTKGGTLDTLCGHEDLDVDEPDTLDDVGKDADVDDDKDDDADHVQGCDDKDGDDKIGDDDDGKDDHGAGDADDGKDKDDDDHDKVADNDDDPGDPKKLAAETRAGRSGGPRTAAIHCTAGLRLVLDP